MLRNAGKNLNYRWPFIIRNTSTSSTARHGLCHGRRGFAATAFGAIISSTAVWYYSSRPIFNEVAIPSQSSRASGLSDNLARKKSDPDKLYSLIWGSNNNGALLPNTSKSESIRTPTVATWLDDVALRDLRLHDSHAACVDARGDVYQWGHGFFGMVPSESIRVPKRTLRGKNIVQLQLTDDKVYALSASGRIYVLASNAGRQALSRTSANDSWGWLPKDDEAVDFVEVSPMEKLGWGESFTSIVAGKNHLLALTSKGRVYAHPVNKLANHFGQLGFRKFSIPNPSSSQVTKMPPLLDVELVPKSLADPYINSSRAVRPTSTPFTSESLVKVDDKDIRSCTNLFEIPVLRGVEAAQIAAGSRTSFMRTKSGRVLAWGANDFGQLGLGSNMPLDTIVLPTEVVLWRFVPNSTESKCLDIFAGGDLTAFVVERKSPDNSTTTDLLMSGNGQYGGLGNNAYTNSQGNPTRVKGISGLLQYDDQTKRLEPIKPTEISISPTGHVLVSLKSSTMTGVGGNDLMVWGKNYESELGNGKKASIAQPVVVESEGERLILKMKRAKEVKDLQGRVWKTGVWVGQRATAGPQNSVVYWKVNL